MTETQLLRTSTNFNYVFDFQLAVVLNVVVRTLMFLMETSLFMLMMMMMMTTMTIMNARGVFAAMEKPLSVNQLTAQQLFDELLLAALIRDRATAMVIVLT